MELSPSKQVQSLIAAARILLVDDDPQMRKVVRAMLYAIGVRQVYEAGDAMSGLDAICAHNPDVVFVDWEMPVIDGAQFVQMVRSPNDFPIPDVPIVMLTAHGERWRVLEAARAGVHEYLLKPVSTKSLQDHLVSVLSKPRPIVRVGGYYGPMPRKLSMFDDRPAEKLCLELLSGPLAVEAEAAAHGRGDGSGDRQASPPVPASHRVIRPALGSDPGGERRPAAGRSIVYLT